MNEPDIDLFEFRRDFDPTKHVTLCATSIEGIRKHLGKDWLDLAKPARERDPRLREARILVKHLIRVASESADFHRTVDFITRPAAMTVEKTRKSNGWKPLAGHLEPSSELAHEHMVPGEAVLLALVRAPAETPLASMLEPLSYRALVCRKKEIHKLDRSELRSALPPVERTRLATRPEKWTSMPPAFNALIRYEAAGLFDSLIPVSNRAIKLMEDYAAWISRLDSECMTR